MSQAKTGDKVKVHYTGKLGNGEIFDSSEGRQPIEFTIGGQQVIPGFENGIIGLTAGDKKTVEIPHTEAYGPHNPENVQKINKSALPPTIDPKVGEQLEGQDEQGRKFVVTVVEVADDEVTLDGNHPLAGKDLTFDLELVEIVAG